MTQMTPPGQYPVPQVPKTNGWAIASLICAIIGCIPVGITGLAAVILGFVGLGKAKQPNTGGKGLAITGIILGVIGILWAGGFIGTLYWGYGKYKDMTIKPTEGILTSLASGDLATATSYTTGNMDQASLAALSEKLKDAGTLHGVSFTKFDQRQTNNQIEFTLDGVANFDSGTKQFQVKILGNPTAGFKVETLQIE